MMTVISMISHAEANTCNQKIENIVRQLSPEKKLHEGTKRIQYDRFLDKIALSLNEAEIQVCSETKIQINRKNKKRFFSLKKINDNYTPEPIIFKYKNFGSVYCLHLDNRFNYHNFDDGGLPFIDIREGPKGGILLTGRKFLAKCYSLQGGHNGQYRNY